MPEPARPPFGRGQFVGLDPARAPAPFSQPGIVTIPLGFVVLVVVSLLTQPRESAPARRRFEVAGVKG